MSLSFKVDKTVYRLLLKECLLFLYFHIMECCRMSILSKAKTLSLLALKPSVLTARSKYLFILSHMRSRSTVLSHVLGSNKGICGYSELFSSYNNYIDLLKLRIRRYKELQCEPKDKYILDKLLHNHIDISSEIFGSQTPKVILLIREPESTIKSIINMGHKVEDDWLKNEKNATEYYCARLSRLTEYAQILDGSYFFIESDDIVNNTDTVLNELSNWLNLDSPLENSYSIFGNTGKPGHGDPSNNILSRKITKTDSNSDIIVSQELLQTANSSYQQCKETLIGNQA